jgi:iron(III) transport system substrate-binding protein
MLAGRYIGILVVFGWIPISSIAAADQSEALKGLIREAAKEGEVVYGSSGETPEMFRKFNRQFNKKFGINIKLKGLPLRSSQAVTRVLQEKAADKITLDVIHPSYTLLQRMLRKGVLAEYDWVGVFGDNLPGLDKASSRVPEVVKNKVLDYQHLVYAPVYNTKLLPKSKVPKKWTDLLKPEWKGKKIIMDPRGNSFYLLFLEYGEKWTLDYASKLVKQDPLLVRGQPKIAKAVARGEAPFGISSVAHALRLKREGKPVDFVAMEVAAVVPQVLVPVKNSPHPNAARLFAAWMATEGLLIEQEADFSGRAWPGSNWEMAKVLEKSGVKVVFLSNPEQFKAAKKMIAKVRKIVQRKKR